MWLTLKDYSVNSILEVYAQPPRLYKLTNQGHQFASEIYLGSNLGPSIADLNCPLKPIVPDTKCFAVGFIVVSPVTQPAKTENPSKPHRYTGIALIT